MQAIGAGDATSAQQGCPVDVAVPVVEHQQVTRSAKASITSACLGDALGWQYIKVDDELSELSGA